MSETGKKKSFEKAVTRLEAIVSELERGEAPLSEALGLFEEGTALLKYCHGELDTAEQKVKALVMKPEQPEFAPFDGEDAPF